ncbi:TlpA family protein disulfide reductase [Vibrio ostreicida]|uniref:Redoxin family protein n=1 Tax=Vibrio ostreicida TaxID=526588 RepID=A0ABT8BZM5_9VIBR|nr:redoxin family protein [Vibrio ostreicida]MDN3612556.1 redoxin family protein [Vibrio ostreicida]NPD09177.1 redoxin family protein [Vibrio ostreicida]
MAEKQPLHQGHVHKEQPFDRALQIVEPEEVNRRIAAGETLVVNIVTAWCPDCTQRQQPHIEGFAQQLNAHNIAVFQVNVQQTKNAFISTAHEALTELFGGRGYPRTVLIQQGVVTDKDNVEIITQEGLSALSATFIQSIQAAAP